MQKTPESKSAGGLVLNQSGEVLLVQEFGEYWGLPRGHIAHEETELAAAKREIFEEAGITDLTLMGGLGSYTRSTFGSDGQPNGKELKHITIFAFTTSQAKLQPRDKDITDAGWFSPRAAQEKFINQQDLEFFVTATQAIFS